MNTERLIPRKIGLKELDTVKSHKDEVTDGKDMRLLEYSRSCWNNNEAARRNRARNYRKIYGDPYADTITIWQNGQKETMTMREWHARQGRIPMTANMLKTQVNTMIGVIVKEQNAPTCNARDRDEQQYGELITEGVRTNNTANRMNKIHNAAALDLLCGGYAALYDYYGYREGGGRRKDDWTLYVDPNYLILETTFRDPRMWDTSLIGVWRELTPRQFNRRYVKRRGDLEKYDRIYGGKDNLSPGPDLQERNGEENISFMMPMVQGNRCVAEIWTLETRECVRVHDWQEATEDVFEASDIESLNLIKSINAERRAIAKAQGIPADAVPTIDVEEYFTEEYWYCRHLAIDGTILDEYESPAADKSHPFVLTVIPFVDGRICAPISDAIDTQDAVNRTVALQDWIAESQVKGMTMMPIQLLPDEYKDHPELFVEAGMSVGNWYFYDAEKLRGVAPQVFHAANVNYDATSWINTLKGLVEGTTGISGAIQGQTPHSGTSAAMFAQQTANASTPIASFLSDIHDFFIELAYKKAKNIAQNYDPERWKQIAGQMGDIFDNANMNLSEVADIEFDIEVKESTDTPVFRAISNDLLLQFWQTGAIDLPMLLEVGDFPFGDTLLQKIQARQAEMQAAQAGAMGAPVQGAAGADMQNPVQTEDYGLPVESTRELVETGL